VRLLILLILCLVGQTAAGGSGHSTVAERLDFMNASLKVHEVWSLPYREAWADSTAPFYVWGFSQEP